MLSSPSLSLTAAQLECADPRARVPSPRCAPPLERIASPHLDASACLPLFGSHALTDALFKLSNTRRHV
jgi:hypothetical protein